MTVAELIEKLRDMPQGATVCVPAMLGGIDDYIEHTVDAEVVELCKAKRHRTAEGDVWSEPWCFEYDRIEADESEIVVIR